LDTKQTAYQLTNSKNNTVQHVVYEGSAMKQLSSYVCEGINNDWCKPQKESV